MQTNNDVLMVHCVIIDTWTWTLFLWFKLDFGINFIHKTTNTHAIGKNEMCLYNETILRMDKFVQDKFVYATYCDKN